MRSRYVLRAREASATGATAFFLEATPGSLRLFPPIVKTIAAGAVACTILSSVILVLLYVSVTLVFPSIHILYAIVPAVLLLAYKSQSWVIMNAVRYARKTNPGFDVRVKQIALSTFNHTLDVEVEGVPHTLRVAGLRRNIVAALRLSGQPNI
jgi:hypothetical protein